jgi:hypothetical protein
MTGIIDTKLKTQDPCPEDHCLEEKTQKYMGKSKIISTGTHQRDS